MGSVGFDGEDGSQPSTSNSKKYKLPRTLLDDCGVVNHASVPRKLRSAIKKRGRESVLLPLPISRSQYHVQNGIETPRKDGVKKSKLNMKQGHITKDEEEVAETLNALADMFSDAGKANQPGLNDEPPETKSSATLEARSSMNAVEDTGILTLQEESRKITSKFTLDAACHSSNLVDATGQGVKFQSLGDAQQPELHFSKQPAPPSAFGNQSGSLGPRPLVSTLDTIPSGEQAIPLEQVTAPRVQCGKHNYILNDKNKGGPLSSATQGSCPRIPAWFENTNSASQPGVITAEKSTLAPAESKKSQKRCSAHVYISRLIKVLKTSEKKENLLEKPTQSTPPGDTELQTNVCTQIRMKAIHGGNNCVPLNGITHSAAEKESVVIPNDYILHKRLLQDQQLASESSASCSSTNQGYDFLSLGTGGRGLDACNNINRAGHSHEAPKQFHASYMQSQNHAAMLFSLPQNSYSSTYYGHKSALAAQQAQLSQYLRSTGNGSLTVQLEQQLESQQNKWATQLPPQYNTGGVCTPNIPDWKNGGRDSPAALNYAHALFPHLHAALGSSKHQQFSPAQQQLMAINSSSLPVKRHHHLLPLGFDRNGAALYSQNIQQLQLPCNDRL